MSTETKADNGLALAVTLADDDLADIEEYFDNKADADYSDQAQRAIGNAEMCLLQAVRRVRALHQRIRDGKPAPTRTGYKMGGTE